MSVAYRRMLSRLFFAAGVTAAVLAIASPAAQTKSLLDDLLRRQLRFTPAELRAVGAGAAVIRSLETPVRQELAHVGVVYLDTRPDRFLERFRNIVQFERGPGIPQIGRFSNPPRIEDLASLTLTPDDRSALALCRPGDCDMKLPASAMERFRTQVNWSSPNAAHQADQIFREMILQLVLDYQRRGNAALGRYDDGTAPLTVADEFRALLTRTDHRPVQVPALMAYLDQYPARRPADTEEFFYWTVVDFGLKLTIRVNHVVIHTPETGPSPVPRVIAIKQLYASHYFFTTLELRFLVDEGPAGGKTGFHLVSLIRSRNDGMTGLKGLVLRPIIKSRSRDAVRGYLEYVKRQVEQPVPKA